MESPKKVIVVAAAAVSLAAAAPAFASVATPAAGADLASLSGAIVTVDALGRPTIDGQDISALVGPKAQMVGRAYDPNNCNCGCKPPRA